MDTARRYRFGAGVELGLRGSAGVLRHFDAEYRGAGISGTGPVDVAVEFERENATGGWTGHGGHKTVRWDVAVSHPAASPLTERISLRGRPLSFGLSLVQGYFVEPLLSIATARAGEVLLPAAAIAEDGSSLLMIGRSRSGKSSLSVRALAAGRRVLGDDQVLVAESGLCSAFPRRMRFYTDLPETAPEAHSKLSGSSRAALSVRKAVKAITRGYVAPSLRVGASELGQERPPDPLPLGRIVVIQRSPGGEALRSGDLDPEAVIDQAGQTLAEQRSRLASVAPAGWSEALAQTWEREAEILRRAFAGVPVRSIVVPDSWGAPRSISALAEELGTERPLQE